MSPNTILIISILAIFNLSLIGILSWIKSKRTPYYFWLGCIFLATALAIIDNTTIYAGKGNMIFYHLGLSTNVVWGAYLLSFVYCLRHPKETKLKFKWHHFIPAYLYIPFFILTLVQPHWGEETLELAKIGKMTPFGVFFNFVICLYSIGSNAFLLWEEYFRKKTFSVSEQQHKRIKEILWIMLILQIMAFFPFLFQLDLKFIILYMPVFGQLFFIYIFIRMIFSTDSAFKTDDGITQNKYSTIKITEQYTLCILDRIIELMKTQKPYLEFDYSLSQLSKELGVSPNILSMVINSKLNCSFPDYINSLRVKTSIELLEKQDKKGFTIESIAYESGFNNRTSFYKAFKKHTGKLPTEYFKSALQIKKVV